MASVSIQKASLTLLMIGLIIALLYFGKSFLVPIVLAAILAMLFTPIAAKIEGRGLNRGLSSMCSVLILLGLVAAIISLISWQVSSLAEDMSQMQQRVQGLITQVRDYVGDTLGLSESKQKQLFDNKGASVNTKAGQLATTVLSSLMGFLVDFILVIVYFFLMLYMRSHIHRFFLKVFPGKDSNETEKVLQEGGRVAQQYLSGMALMIVMLWVLYGIAFSIIGVKNAIFFAILCGLLEIVPFIGNLTGNALTVLMVVSQGGSTGMIIGVICSYLLIQFIQTYLIEPLVVGAEVNINPLFTIMVIVLGELIWGVPGMILAIPALGIVKIIFDHVPELQPYGFLIGSEEQKSKQRKNGKN